MTLDAAGAATLVLTMALLSAAPGPADAAILARSISHGWRQGMTLVLGIVAADAVLIAVALGGLALAAEANAGMFTLIRYGCAAALIVMGIRAWRAATPALPVSDEGSRLAGFGAGFLLTLADPTALVFYFGLMPAVLSVDQAGFADGLLVLALATGVIVAVKSVYVLTAERARRWLSTPRARATLHRLAAVLLIALGMFVVAG